MPLELCFSCLDNDPRCVHSVQYNTHVNLQEQVKTPLKQSHKTALYNNHQHNYFILVLLSRRIFYIFYNQLDAMYLDNQLPLVVDYL